jgi:hypothetical protein
LKRLTFNACDYRCERCLETAGCDVFQKQQERSLLHRLHGRDGDDLAVVLEDVREIFEETKEMLLEKAEEFGIDLNYIPEEVSAAEDREFLESERDPLYKRSQDFTMQTHAFLKNIDSIVTGEARDYFDDILWHHTVVTAKIFRALGSDEDDDILREDSRNSAAVAVKSLTICIMAFEYLASRYPEIAAKCKGLSAIAETIKKDVRARFTRGN